MSLRLLITSPDDQPINSCFLFSADFFPGFHHDKRIFFHDGAFAQDAPSATEIFQRAEKRLQVDIRFFENQVIFLAFWTVLDPRKMTVQALQAIISQSFAIGFQVI